MANTVMVEDRYIGVALPLFGVDSIVDRLSTTNVVVCMLVQVWWWSIAIVGECVATMWDDDRWR